MNSTCALYYIAGVGLCGIIDYQYAIDISGVEYYVIGVKQVFYVCVLQLCKNISAMVPEMGEPMAMPFSGWNI
jgi:hypothetical protein